MRLPGKYAPGRAWPPGPDARHLSAGAQCMKETPLAHALPFARSCERVNGARDAFFATAISQKLRKIAKLLPLPGLPCPPDEPSPR